MSTSSSDLPEVQLLIVDDVEENLVALEALLTQPGVKILRARSGLEALELLLEHEIALALIDVQMPEMSGLELAELMRGSARTRHVPIIFVTATPPERGRIFRGYELGAVDFLFKPIDPHLLRSKTGVLIELHRQRALLAREVAEHRALLRTSEMLLAVLSHDLRTPLQAIMTGAGVLAEMRAEDPMVVRVASRLESSGLRMGRLVSDLLDFASARIGGLPVSPRPSSLGALTQLAIDEFAAAAVRVESRGDCEGTWDPDRIRQLLANLLGNAVAHGTPGGEIAIDVDGTATEQVEIRVENAGAMTVTPGLFTPFVRGDGPRDGRAAGGVGLGLYIAFEIARGHGGTIAAESAGGRTTFIVRLPRHAATRAQRTP